jgi:bifunctional DNA-binding transcriptional regulator/antitoxin component of YhaV-PrlF toxin-antitoxin module
MTAPERGSPGFKVVFGADAHHYFHGYVAVQSRGTVALPAALRKKYSLDRPGTQVEITERADGVLELRPAIAVPATEAWFWDERWQAGEREVDELVAAGEIRTHDTVDDFDAHLSSLESPPEFPPGS